jgi:hypothetical protein
VSLRGAKRRSNPDEHSLYWIASLGNLPHGNLPNARNDGIEHEVFSVELTLFYPNLTKTQRRI